MDGVPYPLQIGSPGAERKASADAVPSALHARSPTTERGNGQWETRPPLTRKNTSGSNRLSQLFPSRPSSISSISPPVTTATSRRTSFPSPLLPVSDFRRTTRSPAPPPPPTFHGTTTYEPPASPFERQDASSSLQGSGSTRKILGRLTSLRGASYQRGSYNRIEDEESDLGRRRLGGLGEGNESTGYLQGGVNAMQMSQIDSPKKMLGTVGAAEQQRDLNEAGYAAEYERLESQLGAGMNSITERPFTYIPAPIGPGSYARQPRGEPTADITVVQARNAQEEAEKTGDIVAVAETPVDISDSFGGGSFETRSMLTSSAHHNKSETQKSYFFPKGLFTLRVVVWLLLTTFRPGHAVLAPFDYGTAVARDAYIHCICTSRPSRVPVSEVHQERTGWRRPGKVHKGR